MNHGTIVHVMTTLSKKSDCVGTVNITAENQVKYCYDGSNDSDHSSNWKERTGLSMETATLQGSSRNSSKKRETKQMNFKEE